MRIAMIGPFGFHPNKTMRARALNLARALVRRNQQVSIFMPPWHTPREADRVWTEDGVAIRYVPLRGGVVGITHRLVRECLAWKPDVVHCFKPKAYSGLAAWWLWRRQQVRLVVDTDDWEGAGGWNEIAPYSRGQKWFFARQERWGMTHCHALTVASRTLQSLAWAQGAPPTRVVYVPNGPGITAPTGDAAARRAALGLGQRPTLLLYSRLFEFDGERLVQILRRVRESVPTFALLMVGAGLYAADAAALRAGLADAGLLPHIVDVGWLEEQDVAAALAVADVGIYLMEDTLLNRTKCPVKLADMLACGVPVVGEAVGQVPEYVVHGQTGLLRPSGDSDGIAADLVELLRNQERRRLLGRMAQAHIEAHFRWDHLAARVEEAYTEQQATTYAGA
ncbi:MAG: glycosyltransferase family 4 protein [Anaerolineales bacterium]|nr:glycosyltransferase family 4 protein [Anaerolineales bacterium]MCB8950878.1 glycosyltransferase family 4 protein [Ardenticatenales bacterium]